MYVMRLRLGASIDESEGLHHCNYGRGLCVDWAAILVVPQSTEGFAFRPRLQEFWRCFLSLFSYFQVTFVLRLDPRSLPPGSEHRAVPHYSAFHQNLNFSSHKSQKSNVTRGEMEGRCFRDLVSEKYVPADSDTFPVHGCLCRCMDSISVVWCNDGSGSYSSFIFIICSKDDLNPQKI